MLSRWKQCSVRGEMTLRPPPGWPMTATVWQPLTYLGVCFLRSYQKEYCMYCLRISSGGCAPKISFSGMLKSSTRTTRVLPPGGAKVSLVRFSIFCSMPAETAVDAWLGVGLGLGLVVG
eukprot:scaffold101154_cov33-Phaeocystis_antarctica.AAC.1